MYIACPGRVKAQSMEQIPARKPKTISRKKPKKNIPRNLGDGMVR